MVKSIERGQRTVWVMRRDESMLDWFSIVRIANVQSVRWVLGALNGDATPVSTRRAQAWSARMQSAGLLDRAQLGGAGGSVLWATYAGTGLPKPDLYRQTTRHEIAVAAASARYVAAGYSWQRDAKQDYAGSHRADGVALVPGWIELIEVELTSKRRLRYREIFQAFQYRFNIGEMSAVTYLCTPDVARTVREMLRTLIVGRVIADRVNIRVVLDRDGLWSDEQLPAWLVPASDRAR